MAKHRVDAQEGALGRRGVRGGLPRLSPEEQAQVWAKAQNNPLPLSHPVWVLRLALAPLLQGGEGGVKKHLLALGQCLPAQLDAFTLAALQGVASGRAGTVLECCQQLQGMLWELPAVQAQLQQTQGLVRRGVQQLAALGRRGAQEVLDELGLQPTAAVAGEDTLELSGIQVVEEACCGDEE